MALEEGDQLNAEAITFPTMALLHLRAAAFFSDRTKALELDHAGQTLGAFWDEILYHATATVFASIAGLEAYANERFRLGARYDQLAPAERQGAREKFYKRLGLVKKFQILVEQEGFAPLELDQDPCKAVRILVELRNGLVHFKPEQTATLDHSGSIAAAVTDEDLHVKLSGELKDEGIQPSQFFGASEPLFPRGWANSMCTSWAVRSASALVKDFEQRTNRVVLSDMI